MAYWLVKSEPSTYGWEDLVRDGRTVWDGITNALALQNLRAARPRDEVVFYHTGGERRAMGIARVARAPYPDPKSGDEKLAVIDLVPVKLFTTPVTLDQIKADPAFAQWDLLRFSRLSFMPVPPAIWRRLLTMAGER
jgi:predicted RNA-binding protein with PUA-like domain